jgi:hypothetical protein
VSDGRAELARYVDATEVRDAARRLLAVGIAPEVQREGVDHLLVVSASDAEAAAALLAIDPSTVVIDDAAAGPEPLTHPDLASDEASEQDELADLVVDERGFVVVAVVDGPTEARAVAGRLLERGIGSELVSAFDTGHANPMTATGDPEAIQVLEGDLDRALSILDLDEVPRRLVAPPASTDVPAPAPAPAAGADPSGPALPAEAPAPAGRGLRRRTEAEPKQPYLGGRLMLTRRQMRTMIAVYVAALVLIPLAFFYLTRWVLTPDVEEIENPIRTEVPAIEAPPAPGAPW